MRWKVRLSDNDDLPILAQDFNDDPDIFEEDDSYYITSTAFNDLDDPDKVRAKAQDIVQTINVFGRFDSILKGDIEASNVHETRDDGITHVSISLSETIGVSDRVEMSHKSEDGEEEVIYPSAEKAKERTKLALKDEKVRELTSLLNRGRSWVNLVRIYEFCEDSMPDGETPASRNWISGNKLSSLNHTANTRDAIGDEARHGREGEAPSNPMNHSEAKALIEKVANHWMDYRTERLEGASSQ